MKSVGLVTSQPARVKGRAGIARQRCRRTIEVPIITQWPGGPWRPPSTSASLCTEVRTLSAASALSSSWELSVDDHCSLRRGQSRWVGCMLQTAFGLKQNAQCVLIKGRAGCPQHIADRKLCACRAWLETGSLDAGNRPLARNRVPIVFCSKHIGLKVPIDQTCKV